ncbi:MAG: histidine kinase [Saprospiraceae bacterium]
MKLKLGTLALWFGLYFILTDTVHDLFIQHESWAEAFEWLWSGKAFALVLTTQFVFFLFSLSTYLLLHNFYPQGKNLYLALGIFGSAFAGIWLRYFIQEIALRYLFGFGNYHPDYELYPYFLDNLYFAIIYCVLGAIVYFTQYSRFAQMQKQALLYEKNQAELSFLRAQINPHFLFNSLNNIYSLVYEKSDQSLPAILKLSSLLRYALYEKSQTVPLGKEWASLQDFFELEKLRYAFEPQLKIEYSIRNEHLQIAPFILLPLVENAFKHGELKDPNHPVQIRLSEDQEQLIFSKQHCNPATGCAGRYRTGQHPKNAWKSIWKYFLSAINANFTDISHHSEN